MTAYKHALNRRLSRRLAVVGAITAGGLLLAACGGNDMEGMDHGSGSSASATSTPSTGDKLGCPVRSTTRTSCSRR